MVGWLADGTCGGKRGEGKGSCCVVWEEEEEVVMVKVVKVVMEEGKEVYVMFRGLFYIQCVSISFASKLLEYALPEDSILFLIKFN